MHHCLTAHWPEWKLRRPWARFTFCWHFDHIKILPTVDFGIRLTPKTHAFVLYINIYFFTVWKMAFPLVPATPRVGLRHVAQISMVFLIVLVGLKVPPAVTDSPHILSLILCFPRYFRPILVPSAPTTHRDTFICQVFTKKFSGQVLVLVDLVYLFRNYSLHTIGKVQLCQWDDTYLIHSFIHYWFIL